MDYDRYQAHLGFLLRNQDIMGRSRASVITFQVDHHLPMKL